MSKPGNFHFHFNAEVSDGFGLFQPALELAIGTDKPTHYRLHSGVSGGVHLPPEFRLYNYVEGNDVANPLPFKMYTHQLATFLWSWISNLDVAERGRRPNIDGLVTTGYEIEAGYRGSQNGWLPGEVCVVRAIWCEYHK